MGVASPVEEGRWREEEGGAVRCRQRKIGGWRTAYTTAKEGEEVGGRWM